MIRNKSNALDSKMTIDDHSLQKYIWSDEKNHCSIERILYLKFIVLAYLNREKVLQDQDKKHFDISIHNIFLTLS